VNKGFFCFKREEHLKGRKEIREVFGKGKHFSCRGAKLFVLENNLPQNRICFTFQRGFGNAVAKNRAKRLSREAFRLMKNRIYGGYDLILLIFPETETTLSDRVKQLDSLFYKAGLLVS
jgi:ribonuclease P protein component